MPPPVGPPKSAVPGPLVLGVRLGPRSRPRPGQVLLIAGFLVTGSLVVWFIAYMAYGVYGPNHIGDGYRARERGAYLEAEGHYKLALATEAREDDLDIAREGLALTYQKMGRHGEAVSLLEECVACQQRAVSAGRPGWRGEWAYVLLLEELATSEIALGRWADADLHLELSLRLQEQVQGRLMGAPSYIVRSQLCRGRGLYADADAFLVRGMGRLAAGLGTDNIAFAMCLEERAVLYREWRPDDKQPDAWEETARAIRSRFPNVPKKHRAGD